MHDNPRMELDTVEAMSHLFDRAREAHAALKAFMLKGGRGTRESNDFLKGLLVDTLRDEMAHVHKPQASFELLGAVWSEEFTRFERLYVARLERIEMFRKDFESSMLNFKSRWASFSDDPDGRSFNRAVDEIQRAAQKLAGPGYEVISMWLGGLEFRPSDLADLTSEDAQIWLLNWGLDGVSMDGDSTRSAGTRDARN